MNYLIELKGSNSIRMFHITIEDIEWYVWWCRTIRIDKSSRYFWQREFLSSSTISWNLSTIRCFIRWCNKKWLIVLPASNIENVKCDRPKITTLDSKEKRELFHAPFCYEHRLSTILRNVIFIKTLYYTWCRISEIINLQFSDIKDNTDQLQITGKGNKVRGVMITNEIRHLIKAYKILRDSDREFRWRIVEDVYKTDNIFVSHWEMFYWKPCDIRTFQDMFALYKKKMGRRKPLTAHILRHTFATDMMRCGGDVRVVQIMLWHTELSTTMRYTHVDDKLIQDTHKLLLKTSWF